MAFKKFTTAEKVVAIKKEELEEEADPKAKPKLASLKK